MLMTPTQLLDRFARARSFRFEARWLDPDGSTVVGRGAGVVTARRTPDRGVVVEELGRWEPRPGQTLTVRGAYRWDAAPDHVSVQHLRRGEDHPVPLLHLVSGEDGSWTSKAPFRCGNDEYTAKVRVAPARVVLDWMVHGPAKAYTLQVTYDAEEGTPAYVVDRGHTTP